MYSAAYRKCTIVTDLSILHTTDNQSRKQQELRSVSMERYSVQEDIL